MLWVKALHIISVIAWMAGLLYLPRLFVYHADVAAGSEISETFKTMERRLYRGIMTPAMIATWVFGLWLVIGFQVVEFSFAAGWWWVWGKAGLVLLLSVYHDRLGRYLRDFKSDRNTKSSRFFRLINEVPTVIMIFVVLLVVVRPV
jgi:protoporphyrinogen IX oxidase